MTITKKYSTEELSFTMTLEQPTPGHVSIPIYANIPETSKPKGIVVMIPEQEFEDDMEILLPKRLGNGMFYDIPRTSDSSFKEIWENSSCRSWSICC